MVMKHLDLLSLLRFDPDLHLTPIHFGLDRQLLNWRYRHLRSVAMNCQDG